MIKQVILEEMKKSAMTSNAEHSRMLPELENENAFDREEEDHLVSHGNQF